MTSIKITPQTSPGELLRRIQALFEELGLLGRTVSVSYQGRQYLAACNEEALTIYRLVTNCHIPPGSPGWPVCLVTADTICDETSPPHLPEDEFSSGLSLPEWLRLLEKTFRT